MDPVAPVTLATDIDVQLKWYLQENPTIFHGLSVAQVPLRFYPYRTLGAHIYGQLSEIGPKQLKDPRFHDYHRGDVIGQSGVERRYDAFLRGTDGVDAVTVDAFGQPTGAVRHVKAPVPGRNVRLTINLDTQRAAEQALAKGVRGAASEGADAGAIVAIDPSNGEIRALASYPTFDPNWFISFRKPKFKRQLTRISRDGGAPAHFPLLDRAIAGRYPAASTFKPFVAIAAVKERRISTDQTLPCTPKATYYHKAFHNWDQTFDGPINLTEALERSCDTYFYKLGDLIFREGGKQGHPLQNWASKFGFGKKTGIDIVGEDPGLLPDPAWKTKFYKDNFSTAGTPSYDSELAVRLELERGRRAQPLDRPGQPQRHAAAARGRVLRHRQRRHGRDAARRRGDPVAGRADAHPAEPGEGAHQHRRVVAELRAHGPAARHAPAERHRDQRVRAVRRPRGRQDGHRPARG